MVLIIGLGVMFSTFLTGPVAVIATIGCVIFGLARGFVTDLLHGLIQQAQNGGGPIESVVRIVTQVNMVQDLPNSWASTTIKYLDIANLYVLERLTWMLPNLTDLGNHRTISDFLAQGFAAEIEYVAQGFDIGGDQLAIRALATAGYLFGMFLVGYIFLKTREIAR
jgi:hypothetical protein